MARQKGIMKLEGTIGGITFYKTSLDGHLAKEKGGVSGNRIASDPAFVRTRENGEEFGAAGTAGKQLRDAIRSLMMTAADNRVTSRLTQVMTDILKTPNAVPVGTGIKLYLLRIEFFQLVNAVQYSLKNGAYNSLAIVEIA